MGMALPYIAMTPAAAAMKARLAIETERQIMKLLEKDIRSSNIH